MSDETDAPESAVSSGLQFFLSAKEPFLVAAFIGEMTKATLPVLETCMGEIRNHGCQLHVLSFHDVETVEDCTIPFLIRLQKELRDRGSLRVCFLKPEVKKFLLDKGAMRASELSDNLADALKALKSGTETG